MNSSAPFIRAQAERMAINAPVQGTSADITRIAMIEIHTYLTQQNLTDVVHMMLQVHDELVFEIKKEEVDRVVPELVRIMEHMIPLSETKGVPLRVEVKVGNNWDEMKKI